MTKLDAICEARGIARKHGWGYAVEMSNGYWYAAPIKPSLRAGKVIEIDEHGNQRHA